MGCFSEEDVKIKFVLPFLTSLGFSEDELRFEKSFRLTFGHATYSVETGKERASVGARLDILVTRNGTNLFIVEVKNDHQPIGIDKDGLLNESNSPSLLLEKLLGIVAAQYAKHFRITSAETINTRLPIPLEKIEYAMRYERALRVFKDDLVDRRLEAGTIQQSWSGSTASYSYQLSADDHTFLR